MLFNRFCAIRWVEDESVAERALSLWPNIIKTSIGKACIKAKDPKTNCTKILSSTTWTNCLH